ncbi:MAG TPA: 3-oxoacyl-ACP synthase III, partial [Lacipirellulaceae bacterium]|nr:3-oxoacyl-ACP synthase III [Lacipirellulaceae bacterium]
GIDPLHVGALVHGSVCRDYLEPATACSVHHAIGLPKECLVLDVSNACLGMLSGMLLTANMIELGQIRVGLVVGAECGRALVEKTVERLNGDHSLNRRGIKPLIASLTIGSGSVAVLLCDREVSRTQNRLLGATVLAHSHEHALCQSTGLDTFMHTDSEQLLAAGVAAAAPTFGQFLAELQWSRDDVDKTVCHQVGVAHRRLLFETLGLDERRDFPTFETLGNTGAAALPLTMALAAEAGPFRRGDGVALLGIGSGPKLPTLGGGGRPAPPTATAREGPANCQMLGVDWQHAPTAATPRESRPDARLATTP